MIRELALTGGGLGLMMVQLATANAIPTASAAGLVMIYASNPKIGFGLLLANGLFTDFLSGNIGPFWNTANAVVFAAFAYLVAKYWLNGRNFYSLIGFSLLQAIFFVLIKIGAVRHFSVGVLWEAFALSLLILIFYSICLRIDWLRPKS